MEDMKGKKTHTNSKKSRTTGQPAKTKLPFKGWLDFYQKEKTAKDLIKKAGEHIDAEVRKMESEQDEFGKLCKKELWKRKTK